MVGIFGYSVTDGVGLVTRRNIANFGFATPSLGHDMARDVRLGVIGSASNEAIPFCMPRGRGHHVAPSTEADIPNGAWRRTKS
jgi:hypothetical protein